MALFIIIYLVVGFGLVMCCISWQIKDLYRTFKARGGNQIKIYIALIIALMSAVITWPMVCLYALHTHLNEEDDD